MSERWGGKTPRYLMQTLGTEWGRMMVDGDLWVELCCVRIRWALSQGTQRGSG